MSIIENCKLFFIILISNFSISMTTHTIGTNGLRNVKANRAWHPMVETVPRIIQNIFLPDLSIRNPNKGDATADIMYTKLKGKKSMTINNNNIHVLIYSFKEVLFKQFKPTNSWKHVKWLYIINNTTSNILSMLIKRHKLDERKLPKSNIQLKTCIIFILFGRWVYHS